MTTIYFTQAKDEYIVSAKEHAGDPLICAGISALMCGLYNAAYTLPSVKLLECDGFTEHSGDVTIRFSGGKEAHAIYTFAIEGLRLIEAKYPDNVTMLPKSGGENVSEI